MAILTNDCIYVLADGCCRYVFAKRLYEAEPAKYNLLCDKRNQWIKEHSLMYTIWQLE